MKKSTLIAVSGLVIVFLFMSAIQNKTKVYEKQITYETPEEAIVNFIGYANIHEKVKLSKGIYEDRTPQEFYESISRRYRLYNSNNSIVNPIKEEIPILYQYELSLVNKEEINHFRDSYEKSYNLISNYRKPDIVKFYKLDSIGGYGLYNDKSLINENGTIKRVEEKETITQNMTIYLVVVNEGEGYVVDYYEVVHK